MANTIPSNTTYIYLNAPNAANVTEISLSISRPTQQQFETGGAPDNRIYISSNGQVIPPAELASHYPRAATSVTYLLYPSGNIRDYSSINADGSGVHYVYDDAAPGKQTVFGPNGEYTIGRLKFSQTDVMTKEGIATTVQDFTSQNAFYDLQNINISKLGLQLIGEYNPLTNTSTIQLIRDGFATINKSYTGNINKLVGMDGASLIGNDGSTLIGNDGSTLIGNDGSTLIGQDGGSLIGRSIASLIGMDGGSLIGNDGSTLVGPGGISAALSNAANVIARDGAGLVVNSQANFALGIRAYNVSSFASSDDFTVTSATKGVVTLNAAATSGKLEKNGDHDWFKVNLIAGAQYTIEAKGAATNAGTLNDPKLKLFFGNIEVAQDDDAGAGYDAKIIYTAATTGTYYIDVGGYDEKTTGTYKVQISGLVGTAGNDIFSTVSSQPFRTTTNGEDVVHGLGGNDVIIGGGGNDKLFGGDNDDGLSGGVGADLLDGGSGSDTITYLTSGQSSSTVVHGLITVDGVHVDLVNRSGQGGEAQGDTYVSIENVIGSSYNDIIYADGTTSNRLTGGLGNDTVSYERAGLNAGVKLSLAVLTAQVAGSGADTLSGIENLVGTDISTSGDSLTGNAEANMLVGLGGDDKLDGAGGADRMYGGLGNDIYIVDNAGDAVFELNLQGIDEIRSSVAIAALAANVENLTLGGASAINANGNELDNKIIGNALANVIEGLDGDDWLIGGAGNDTLRGGLGVDKIQGGAGADTLDGGKEDDPFVQLLERDILSYEGDSGGVALTLGELDEVKTATGVATGSATGDSFVNFEDVIGSLGNDTITGNSGINFIDGRAGADVLKGMGGDDIFTIRGDEAVGDRIDGGDDGFLGGDVIFAAIATVTLTNINAVNPAATTPNVKNVERWDGEIPHALLGTAANNMFDFSTFTGMADLTYVDGAGGNDIIKGTLTYSYNDNFRGGAGDDELYGNAGNDTLEGGAGKDILDGGEGDDILIVSSLDAVTDIIRGGNGNDEVRVTGNKALALNHFDVNPVFGSMDPLASIEKWTGNGMGVVGNAGANLLNFFRVTSATNFGVIDGGAGDDVINGTQVADIIIGGVGKDILIGNDGDDILNGGLDADILRGGNGLDTVDYSFVTTAINLTLSADDQEVIAGIGGDTLKSIEGVIGGTAADTLTGTAGANRFDGGNGADTINAGDGDDIIVIKGAEAVADIVNAGSGGETIGDTLVFGGTTDVFLNNFNAATWDVEVLQGNGRILRGAGAANVFDFSGFTDVYNRLDRIDGGIGDDTIIGVNLDDSRGADTIRGGNDKDKIYGLKGNDALYGDAGDDLIEGGEGDDFIEGGVGNDQLYGGIGNDTFLIQGADAKGDTIRGEGGQDAISVTGPGTVNVTLTSFDSHLSSIEKWFGSGQAIVGDALGNTFDFSNIETLGSLKAGVKAIAYIDGLGGNDTIRGTQKDDDIRGGSGLDTIFGGGGNDTINGGLDYDEIHGGDGDDTFIITGTEARFDDLYGDAGTDTIKVTGTTAVTLHHFSTVDYSLETWIGNGKGVIGDTLNNLLDFSNLTTVSAMGTIDGGAGDDTIAGSFTSDRIITGTGDDTVIYRAGFGIDTVTDFTAGGTLDQIDLSSFTNIRSLQDLQAYIVPGGPASTTLSFKFNSNDYLNLEKVKFSQLTADDFIFYTPSAAAPVHVSAHVADFAPYDASYLLSQYPAISASGKFATYQSLANNGSFQSDVFLTEIGTGVTKLVSHTSGSSTQNASGASAPDISADGRFVLFSATTGALDANFPMATDGGLFIYDASTGLNRLVSVDGVGSAASGYFFGQSLSADARYVTYITYNDMTGAGTDSDSDMDLYRFDQTNGAVQKLTDGMGFASETDISDDGRFVAYGGGSGVFVKDVQTGVTTTISSSASAGNISISPNGQFVLFDTAESKAAGDTNGASDVYLYNLATSSYSWISEGSAGARYGSMSADGKYVAFHTSSPLVPSDTGIVEDVYIKNLADGSLVRIATENGSSTPSLSADGSIVVYRTADDIGSDNNGAVDIHATTLLDGKPTIFGNFLANTLTGTAASETIIGYDGDDIIEGKGGADLLIGGGGADKFVYNDVTHSPSSSIGALDTIMFDADFDLIDLSGIDAIEGNGATNDAFVFNGGNPAGALIVQQMGMETVNGINYFKSLVVGSTDSDVNSEIEIFALSSRYLQASDFIL